MKISNAFLKTYRFVSQRLIYSNNCIFFKGDTILKKFLIPLILFSVISASLLSGCLTDPVVGKWSGENDEAEVIFNSDKTFQIRLTLFYTSGTWEKSNGRYVLYHNGTPAGTAEFDGKELHIVFGSGLLGIDENFKKQ